MNLTNRISKHFGKAVEAVPINPLTISGALDYFDTLEPRKALVRCEALYDKMLNQFPQEPDIDYKLALESIAHYYINLHNQLNQSRKTK